MEYGRRQPIKGISGQEQTAFTMKTIKELLAEDTSGAAQAPLMRSTQSAEPAGAQRRPDAGQTNPPAQGHLQQPPHLRQPRQAPVPARNGLKASTAPVFEVERTAPPMPMPKVAVSKAAALPPLAPETDGQAEKAAAEKPKSLLKRLIGG